MTDISATAFFRSAGQDIRFEHEEQDTGGTKWPTKVTLHALHPETGERMGFLEYRVPRRKADKIAINRLETHEGHQRKGVGSALMDEMQRRHPGTPIDHGDRTADGAAWWKGYTDGKSVSRGRTMAKVTFPGSDSGYERPQGYDHSEWADDNAYLSSAWDRWHPKLQPTIHRSLAVDLPSSHMAHDTRLPTHERAQALIDHIAGDGLGRHWTDDPHYKHLTGARIEPSQTAVTVHAHTPGREHIETDAYTHDQHAIRDWDSDEREVPLRRGTPLHITGISWDGPEGKIHHTFDQPLQRTATVHPGPTPESFAQQDGEDRYAWQDRVRRGLSLGHLTHAQAEAHKYYGRGHESNGWKPLPQTLYHTTTDVAGVQQNGLKSGSELGQERGHGLGGTPDYLSMTDSAEHAHNMLSALHEYHDVLNGKTTMHDLKDAADRGEGAKQPFGKEYAGIFGHDPEHAKATMNEQVIEPGFRTHDEAAEQGLTPHPTLHRDFGEGPDGRRAGSGWIRPMTDREKLNKRHEAYSAFSQARHWKGEGKPGVLFLSNDRAAFAAKDPSNFGVLKVRPKPGAQGHYLPGEHEWRTGTGAAVEVHGEPLRRTSARIGQAMPPFPVTAAAGPNEKTCNCCGGLGEHNTGFECYLCDAGGGVPHGTPDDERCDGSYPDGGPSHNAAAKTAAVQDGDDVPSLLLNPHGHHVKAKVGGYSNVEMVPRHEIERYASQPTDEAHMREVGRHVATSGEMEPLILHYHPASGTAYLGEGNHRLRASRHLKMDHLPLRVERSNAGLDGPGVPTPQRHPAQETGGHVPAEIKPSELGLTVVDKPTIPKVDLDEARHTYNLLHSKSAAANNTPVPDNTVPYEHLHDWLPESHFFAPAHHDLDPRLFDGQQMHPAVRQHILGLLNGFWGAKYGDSWQSWARVYLAGSEASHFYGNGDLDILIGVNTEALNHHVDEYVGEPDGEIERRLTDELREHLNDPQRMLPGPDGTETGPFENTWFVINSPTGDIRDIHPYAAYDITADTWAVPPVEVPDDFGPTKLPEAQWDIVDAVRKLVDAIGELPAGTREREGAALYDYLHTDRSAAFGDQGSGLYDPANVTWKSLVDAPGQPLQQLVDWKHAHDRDVTANLRENAA